MRWAKTRPAVRYDLAGSNLLPVTAAEWPAGRDAPVLVDTNEEGLPPLVEAIAAHAGVAPGRVATAAGSSGANFLAMAALLRPGDAVVVEDPVYDPLPGAARLLGADIHGFPRRFEAGYRLDPAAVEAAITPRTRLVVLTNPNNPTGALADNGTLDALAGIAERADLHVLVDEVYLDTTDGHGVVSAATVSDRFIATSSLTKAYGLYGLRCGWAVASDAVARRIREARDVVDGVGAIPAEHLAVRAFADLPLLRARALELVETNGRLVRAFLHGRSDVRFVDPACGTVVFPRLERVADVDAFCDRLLTRFETALVPGRFFGAPQHVRIAFGGATDTLRAGLEALGRALDEAATDG